MRIGIDGLPLTESLAGIGNYTLELARNLALSPDNDQVELISPRPFLQSIRSLPPNVRLTEKKPNLITKRWWSIGLPRYLGQNHFDLFHGTNFEIPMLGMCPTVLTIHDLSLLHRPRTHERRRVLRALARLPLMARRATMIVTDSDFVSSEIQDRLRVPAERIVTVHLAARKQFQPMEAVKANEIRTRLKVNENFILYVGTIEPRKNLNLLMQAFAECCRSNDGLQLVLAGREGWLVGELQKSLKAQNVVCTGYLNDEELCALYSTCKLFVFPSLYEGFGLPPLEAMACGAPVIASRISSIEEVLGYAARLISPKSIDELAAAMKELLENDQLRAQLSAAGLKRASEYSWTATAARTREVYEEAISRFKRE